MNIKYLTEVEIKAAYLKESCDIKAENLWITGLRSGVIEEVSNCQLVISVVGDVIYKIKSIKHLDGREMELLCL